MKHLKGSCLCGSVEIQVPDNFHFIGYCHCSECRKWSGSAFTSGGLVDSADFQITKGEESVSYFHKSEETDLAFCKNCGSSLFSKKLKRGKSIVRLGILNDAPSQKPSTHIFVGSKAPWYDISDKLTQFDELPQGSSFSEVSSQTLKPLARICSSLASSACFRAALAISMPESAACWD
ncbi:hypothetical protein BTA51_11145 [Hahella sp. CCB-MM4]|uniref:GFA family protein n=1 Tax=Hahella sp. (strain CCB-MM4) TaxID=1926491 RepID=UPI000B9B3A83|nr:hypothetical protein BTA51_11145 [Hahella sp. CCB-MM4]